jgi:alpha-D-ribose 1-methylphosphonate 5-triphosphate synthase subunit PhnI
MAYVAARGGEKAIQNAEKLHRLLHAPVSRELVSMIKTSMPYLLDRVMGEGSLYAPELAALTLAQTGGDYYEAVLLLRAYRSTQPRLAYAQPIAQDDMLTVRRISAAFKDIPGGQILGPTLDYSHRVLNIDVLEDDPQAGDDVEEGLEPAPTPTPPSQPAVATWQRQNRLLADLASQTPPDDLADLPDLTREPMLFPASREHRLQALARADTGGVLTLGYSDMRGYGTNHPTVNEVRLAYADVNLTHPVTGAVFSAGKIRVSQAEVVSSFGGSSDEPQLDIGFSATLGWNEVKTIAASMLDMAMDKPDPFPALSEEYVLYHTEPVESSGFCIHYKLPHYVTFQSSLEAMRKATKTSVGEGGKGGKGEKAKATTENLP